jgi:hypothetical protein
MKTQKWVLRLTEILTTPFPCLEKPTTLTKQNKSGATRRETKGKSSFFHVFVELRDIL